MKSELVSDIKYVPDSNDPREVTRQIEYSLRFRNFTRIVTVTHFQDGSATRDILDVYDER